MPVSSSAIADRLDADHVGPVVRLSGFDSLGSATPDELAFCVYDDPDYLRETDAGAVVCSPSVGTVEGCTQIVTGNPRAGFARATNALFVDDDRGEETFVHPTTVVEDGATIGDGCRIGPNAYVGAAAVIGDGCTIRAGATIGCPGFGYARDDGDQLHRLPHRGSVRIEDDVEIGPNTSVDRAVFDETVVGRNTKLSANVHVAHQVRIGRNTSVAYGAGFSGRATVGDGVTVHPHVAVADGVTIGDGAEIGINSTVLEDVPEGVTAFGSPAQPRTERDSA